ncbi:type IV toxin-antitoxin system AbiEi family antitoxin domain-containing protein [Microlunatus sp. GCM10028923]|uniref:type IV toxin-antitoxin system AbiEi family antitoxin domain-containing protein n=1 Tax=Microlunatus sp. GCM10028923 TaxID=3273400 RepID=UPI003618FC8B
MKKRNVPSAALRELAAAQAGVISLDQADAGGLSRHSVARLVEDGHWRRLDRSVLYLYGQPPPFQAMAWAGILLGGPEARVGGEAAASLHGLTDDPPDRITIMIPAARRLRDRWPWTFQRERPGIRSDRSPGSPPRLTVEDTVLDLCLDQRSTLHWLTTAVQRRRTTAARLRHTVGERRRLTERRLVLDLLTDAGDGVESPLEHHYLQRVERRHALPRGRRQVRRHGRRGKHDVGYPDYGVLVELDGHRGHTGSGRFRDMQRDNEAIVDGLVTLRYGWSDVIERPCAVATQVAAVLTRRGWPAVPTSCPTCPGT